MAAHESSLVCTSSNICSWETCNIINGVELSPDIWFEPWYKRSGLLDQDIEFNFVFKKPYLLYKARLECGLAGKHSNAMA